MAGDDSGDKSPRRAAPAPDGPATRVLIRFEAVSKRFGEFVAIDRLSLDIHKGEFFALLGPSGCGKTTLLRMLGGFERPSEGRILLDGEDIADVPPHRRAVNIMFQNYALFPHLTVAGNIAFGLKQEHLPVAEIEARVREMLELVKLEGFGERKPHQLSGGQRQRVALARALAKRPRAFLLDEPLAALDRKLREETRFELKELQHKLGLTFIVVTHDQEEAMTVADRIGVMNAGRLAQVGKPAAVYEQPNSRWVADFIGDVNLMQGRVVSAGIGLTEIEGIAGERLRVAQTVEATPGMVVWVAVRPEKIGIETVSPLIIEENRFAGRVVDVAYLGGTSLYKVRLDNGQEMKAAVANRTRPAGPAAAPGSQVWLTFSPDAGVVLMR